MLLKQLRPDSQRLQEMLDTRLQDLLNYWKAAEQQSRSPGDNHSGRGGDSSSCRKRKLLTLYYGDENGCDIKEEHRGFPCLCGEFVTSSAGHYPGSSSSSGTTNTAAAATAVAVSPTARKSSAKQKGKASAIPSAVKQKGKRLPEAGGGGDQAVTCACCNKPRHLGCAKIDPSTSSKSDAEDDYGKDYPPTIYLLVPPLLLTSSSTRLQCAWLAAPYSSGATNYSRNNMAARF